METSPIDESESNDDSSSSYSSDNDRASDVTFSPTENMVSLQLAGPIDTSSSESQSYTSEPTSSSSSSDN